MAGRVIFWRVRKVVLLPGDDHLRRAHLLEPCPEAVGIIDLLTYLNPLDIAKVQLVINAVSVATEERPRPSSGSCR
jgi:hypothetical protein